MLLLQPAESIDTKGYFQSNSPKWQTRRIIVMIARPAIAGFPRKREADADEVTSRNWRHLFFFIDVS